MHVHWPQVTAYEASAGMSRRLKWGQVITKAAAQEMDEEASRRLKSAISNEQMRFVVQAAQTNDEASRTQC